MKTRKAIEFLDSKKMTVGHFGLGMWGVVPGTVPQVVHDGDTLSVRAAGNFGVRFLGVDAHEMSFPIPKHGSAFISIASAEWTLFLTDPFADEYGPIKLSTELRTHLQKKCLGKGTAPAHHQHAVAAEKMLEAEIKSDMEQQQKTTEEFRFFLAFSHEVVDRYGRLLAFINREDPTDQRPPDYNRRLLQKAQVCPYFIWPNVNPFRTRATLADAVPPPHELMEYVAKEKTLEEARTWVKSARQHKTGIFEQMESHPLLPFELRFLAQRRAPDRYVINLGSNKGELVEPQEYFTIPNMEDRLFVPADFLSLFLSKGWKVRK